MKDNLNDDSQINDLNIPSGAVHSILKESKLIHSSNHISLSAKTAKNVHLNHLSLKDLKLAIVNFCSVTNKRPHLEAFLVSNNVDILIGTESEIFPTNYNTYRKDRNCYGGGVFITVKSSVPSYQIDIDSSSIEIICAYLHIRR